MDKMSKRTGLPKYTFLDKNRSGSERVVLRRPGQPKIVLPWPPLTDRFWAGYFAGTGGRPQSPKPRREPRRVAAPGTLRALCEKYFASGSFKQHDQATQRDKRGVLETILREQLEVGKPLTFEDCPIKSLNRRLIALLRDRKMATPSAANKRMKYLRRMFRWAISEDRMQVNPVDGVERLERPKKGFHTWTLDEAGCYVETHPIGTKAYLAFALMAFIGLRISDVCQLGRQHINNHGVVSKPQHKNRKRDAKMIEFEMPEFLREIIDRSPTGDMHYLVTERGLPFTIKGASNKIKDWCAEAGIPHCSAHGIRKLASVVGAENGMTAEQMKALFNWSSSRQADTYTDKANKKKLASQAVRLLTGIQEENEIAPRTGSGE
jgi:integrase